jgi:hypothetical protein
MVINQHLNPSISHNIKRLITNFYKRIGHPSTLFFQYKKKKEGGIPRLSADKSSATTGTKINKSVTHGGL